MTNQDTLNKTYSSVATTESVYKGSRSVTVNKMPLPDVEGIGFIWGQRSRRSQNLARSIMADYFEDANVPEALWSEFFEDVLSIYKATDEWDITGQMISEWIYRKFQSEEEAQEEEP